VNVWFENAITNHIAVLKQLIQIIIAQDVDELTIIRVAFITRRIVSHRNKHPKAVHLSVERAEGPERF
jgi:hypothetical protein